MMRNSIPHLSNLTGFLFALLLVLGAHPTPASATQSTKERVLQNGTLIIGIHNRAPWGYRDEKTNELSGWHPDLMKAAFADLGVKEIELRVTEFGALIPGLLAGRFDAIASGLAITPERCKQVAFGTPDLKVPDAAIVLTGNPKAIHSYSDIASRQDIVMGAGRGSTTAKHAAAAGVPEERMLLFPDVESNLSALRAGRIDVTLFSSPTVIGLLSQGSATDLERASPFTVPESSANYAAIAFRLEDRELRDIYNRRLETLKADGTLGGLMNKYGFGDPEAVPPGLTADQLCGNSN
ncbi:ectoine/hydroxyectoine ABC transporter substrate-binding protein EhuB [Pseudaminobacter sp. NGMCC 1.201702]|uniref:ectoine/hydroxyectoine ABC transporter substrate-binding protein EhuB n=1 Tax=Pseudaminobacter sp. NGMCC 1.201702 TaxID=3391825 RepID=UPI0039F0D61B